MERSTQLLKVYNLCFRKFKFKKLNVYYFVLCVITVVSAAAEFTAPLLACQTCNSLFNR